MVSEDGLEFRFQVNHLSHFMLTRLWLPLLEASAPSRIVNVSSGAQQPIDFDDVMLERDFGGGRAYAQSKLAQILFTVESRGAAPGQRRSRERAAPGHVHGHSHGAASGTHSARHG